MSNNNNKIDMIDNYINQLLKFCIQGGDTSTTSIKEFSEQIKFEEFIDYLNRNKKAIPKQEQFNNTFKIIISFFNNYKIEKRYDFDYFAIGINLLFIRYPKELKSRLFENKTRILLNNFYSIIYYYVSKITTNSNNYSNELNEILNTSNLDDCLKLNRISFVKLFLNHFIVQLDLKLIKSIIYSNFQQECNTIIKNKTKHILSNRLLLALESSSSSSSENNKKEISMIIIQDIILLILKDKPSIKIKEIINLSKISKRIFSLVSNYITLTSNKISKLINYKDLIKKQEKQIESSFSIVQFKKLKYLSIDFDDFELILRNNDLLSKSIEFIKVKKINGQKLYSLDCIFKGDNLEILKEKVKTVEFKCLDIGLQCGDKNKEPAYIVTTNEHQYYDIYIRATSKFDFSIISKLIANISAFLRILYHSGSISILQVNHLVINAPLYFDYQLALNFYKAQQLLTNKGDFDKIYSNIKLSILEINLEHQRSIERILNIFKYFATNIETIKFNIFYDEYDIDSLISPPHQQFQDLYSTIFYLISSNPEFNNVKSIIIINRDKRPLFINNWDIINYYSFTCSYPFDFTKFTRVDDKVIISNYRIELYGNNIKEFTEYEGYFEW